MHSVVRVVHPRPLHHFCTRAGEGSGGFAGKYQGTELSAEITPDGAVYSGQISMGQSQFPLRAREEGGHLAGTFASQGNHFDFTATLRGDDLTLVTGGATYALKRASAPANPLAPPQARNPLAKPAAAAEPAAGGLAGYTVVISTESGKALSAQKPQATSVQSALRSTFPDLAGYFDDRPAIGGAYEDVKDHRSGGTSFTAKLKGQPVKGFVSCKLGEKGAAVAVVYCRSDAPPTEWQKLTHPPGAPIEGSAPAGAAAAAPDVALREYQFPDSTGSVGVAEGWQTNAPSCLGPVQITGPADQRLTVGFTLSVVTPDSMAVQTQRQLEAQARQMRLPPPARPQMFVAPMTTPAEALANLVPQISQVSQQNGGPAVRLDRILQQQAAKANLPNANAALLTYQVTRSTRGVDKRFRALAQVEVAPILQGSWMFYAIEAAALDETFDRDLPVMLTMLKSFKTNDRVIQDRTRARTSTPRTGTSPHSSRPTASKSTALTVITKHGSAAQRSNPAALPTSTR